VGFAAYEDPPLLAPLGSALLGTQPGTVPWNGADPLNILVMGIDQRTHELTRSDSMIVLHVDPSSQNVTMLSIPRDLWVRFPSPNPSNQYGYYKINAAYALGASYGQGPQFAQLAVESALGIPLNYYAVLKFSGFKRVVDAMGGVTVCVPHELYDPNYPDDVGYGAHTIDIKAGCQKMDGTTALVYARERHADAEQDLGRIQQQQVLLAGVEKQLLSSGTLLRSPAILSAVDGAVITDLPHGALPELGVLLGHARGAHTRHAYLNADGGYVTDTTATDGQNILAGNWPRINALVAHLFADPPLRSEHASVQVRNGQHTPGLAALYTTILQGAGVTTVAPRNADRDTYTRNLLIVNEDRPGADYTARKLTQMLQADVSTRHLGPDHAQIIVILGADAAEGT
jgi:LCP family protein required for cell wall assembly